MTSRQVSLRDAKISDCEKIFAWRNDPKLIAVSSSGETVDWDTHQAWFAKKVADPAEIFLVIQAHGGKEIGVIRLDNKSQGVRTINIYLDPDYFGKGMGTQALALAVEAACDRDSALRRIEALVGEENIRSRRMFESIGFQVKGRSTDPSFLEYCYVYAP